MENIILVIHLVVAVAIIGLILLQQGKGAEMGASFGSGASQTVFGSGGSGNFFSRMTAVLATVFFATSFSLAVVSRQSTEVGADIPPAVQQQETGVEQPDADIPTVEEETPAGDIPAAPSE